MRTCTKRKVLKDNRSVRVILVAGARPNFMKCAPLLRELKKESAFKTLFVHTGQHYDYDMSHVFFKHLSLEKPDVFLNVGSLPRPRQIARVKQRFEKVVGRFCPDIVIVVGDVNSTLGAAVASRGAGVRLAHVEAGLRSFDRSMPEEINRVLTDSMSDFAFTTSKSADANLIREGLPKEKIHFVGNVMIDTLVNSLKKAERSDILKKYALFSKKYYVLTLHRPSNVDGKRTLAGILDSIDKIARGHKIVFPAHPRTRKALERFGLLDGIKTNPSFVFIKPLGYLDFIKLVRHSRAVFTDSGGIQEETAYLKIPCLTLRKNTERPVTVEAGINIIAGNSPAGILMGFGLMLKRQKNSKIRSIKFWDGKASKRIIKVLLKEVAYG